MAEGSFKFNFSCADEASEKGAEHVRVHGAAKVLKLEPPSQVAFRDFTSVSVADRVQDEASCSYMPLKKVVIDNVTAARMLDADDVKVSDLLPGKYEGGFKLWEGALDLLELLLRACHRGPGCAGFTSGTADTLLQHLSGKRVLELGCGHGLPGILALCAGAHVTFNDFNAAVLEHATAVNVAANISKGASTPGYQEPLYISGDFESVCRHLHEDGNAFDVILTSESIYNSISAQQILDGADLCLAKHGGLYVAAKSHYFGVGGGLAAFKNMVQEDGRFAWNIVLRIDDGCSMTREVLKLQRAS